MRAGIGVVIRLAAAFAYASAAAGEEVSAWVSVAGNNGAIKVSTNGAILAQTTNAVAQTFEALAVNAFTGDLFAWNDVAGDNLFLSALYRFDASGRLLASLTGLRQYGLDPYLAQKKMVLDPVARNIVFVTGGYYYVAEGGYYLGIQKFLVSDVGITRTLDTNLGSIANGSVAVDADVERVGKTGQSRVYVGLSGIASGNLRVYDATSDFSLALTNVAAGTYNNTIVAMAEYRGTNALAAVGTYNDMSGVNVTNLTPYGSTPGIAPDPPFSTYPQTSPATNGAWWKYFVGNPYFAGTIVGSPVAKGIVVDDGGFMWLSAYGTANSGAYTNNWLIRLRVATGAMAAGFPISLSNQAPTCGLALDSEGGVWMGTTGGNLYRFSMQGGISNGTGTNLTYSIPSSALVFATNQSLILGSGDATGYDHVRKRYRPLPSGTVVFVQ